MTEQELRRTAVIIPPTGRAVLCVWAAVPGLFAAPFVFWQSVAAGAGFCLLWGFLVYCLWARACSFAAVLGERTVTVYSGVALPVRQVLPRRAVTSVRLLRTPLLRLGGVSLLIVAGPRARSSFCPPSRPSRPGSWLTFWRRMHHDPTTALPPPRRPPLPAQGGRRLPAAAGECPAGIQPERSAHSSAAGRRASALPLRGQLHPAGSQQLGAG